MLKMDYHLITTASELSGWKIKEHLGIVHGIVILSRSMLNNSSKPRETQFTELCDNGRNEALRKMIQHAEKLGANAIVGLRYNSTELMSEVNEVFCYGTAVVVSRN
jgi:uncharacterized protein YbjQ (UPF0145 family)